MAHYFRLLRYARREQKSFLLILILTIVSAALLALQPWPLKLLIDHVLLRMPVPEAQSKILAWFSLSDAPTSVLVFLVVAGLVLFGLNSAVDAALSWVWTLSGRRLVYG